MWCFHRGWNQYLTSRPDEGEAEASHFVMAVKLLVKFSIMCQNQWRLKANKILSHDTIIPLAVFLLIQYFLLFLSSDGYISLHMPIFSLLKSCLFLSIRSILFRWTFYGNDSESFCMKLGTSESYRHNRLHAVQCNL